MNWSTGLTVATLAAMGIGAVVEILTNRKAEDAKEEAKAEMRAEMAELRHENLALREDLWQIRLRMERYDTIFDLSSNIEASNETNQDSEKHDD